VKSLNFLNLSEQSLTDLSNDSFNGLYDLEAFHLRTNRLTNLPLYVFKELFSLKYLHLDENKLETLSKEIFFGLSNLTNLSISHNRIISIQNETFIYLINLRNLTLNSNQIKFIDKNGFKGIDKLIYLNLNNNSLNTFQVNNQSYLINMSSLVQLGLAFNRIRSIVKTDLIGLTHLEILDLKSNENESIQIEANSFDSFSSSLHRLYLEMRNISLENIYNIRNSFKPKMVKKYSRREYFLPVHIENRVDIECSRTLLFMRSKLLYNFLNEYIDVDDFLINCMNLTKLRNDLNSLEKSLSHINSIQLESYSKHVNEPDDKIYAYYILACVVIALIYFLWKCFIKHKTELIKSIIL
jgi:Leucine-rich repeat (LRR) protein